MSDHSPPPAEPALHKAWALHLGVLFMTHVLGMMHLLTVLAMAPVVRNDLDLSATEFGFLVSAYSAAQGVFAVPFGWLGDRIGVARTLQLGTCLLAVGTSILTQADGLWFALLAMTVTGTGYAGINPATSRAILEWFPRRWRASAMGIKQTGVPVGGMAAAATGTLVVLLDWRTVMWLVVGVTAAAVALTMMLPRAAPRPPGAAAGPAFTTALREILKDLNLGVLNLSVCFYNIGQQNLFAYLTLFVREGLQASLPVASLCLGAAQAASVAGRLGWGVVSDRLLGGRRKPVLVAIGIASTLLFVAIGLLPPGAAVALAFVLAVLLGLTITAYAALVQTMLIESAPPNLAGATVGYNKILLAVGATVGPPLFGAVVDSTGGYGMAWLMCGGFAALAALLFGRKYREPEPTAS
ncbi:MAG: MFS transporter [Acetobacterales bacterium]